MIYLFTFEIVQVESECGGYRGAVRGPVAGHGGRGGGPDREPAEDEEPAGGAAADSDHRPRDVHPVPPGGVQRQPPPRHG